MLRVVGYTLRLAIYNLFTLAQPLKYVLVLWYPSIMNQIYRVRYVALPRRSPTDILTSPLVQ